jgi:LytS/YehU family sensor histidine kinase
MPSSGAIPRARAACARGSATSFAARSRSGPATRCEELTLVERYLDIEQSRFGDRLRVERAVDPDAVLCRVPPLLLQPLVENAIKHGIQDCLEGGTIRIEARRDGALLRVVVENPVDADAPSRRGEGVGLENVRRRLEVFGARDAQLSAALTGGRFRVTLTLPALAAAEVQEANHA